jgi:predicted Zn-dependent protease
MAGAALAASRLEARPDSTSQDVALGREAAAALERRLPLARDADEEGRLQRIASRLARHAPGPRYEYRLRLLDDKEVNAYALPGGFLYLSRGMIEAAANEGQLAGVIAHEMAHIALRHAAPESAGGATPGLELLGRVIGGGSLREGGPEARAGALLLKYSQDREAEADVAGARMMDGAGYDPMDMARFFDRLEHAASREPSKVERFLVDHPAPAGRAARIRDEARRLGRP